MKKIILAQFLVILSGCGGLVGVKKPVDYVYYGEVKGKYEELTYCVVNTMAADKRWKINKLKYEISDYPNTKKLQINARSPTLLGQFYVFRLELNQTADDTSSILLKGFKFESEEALKVLKRCTKK